MSKGSELANPSKSGKNAPITSTHHRLELDTVAVHFEDARRLSLIIGKGLHDPVCEPSARRDLGVSRRGYSGALPSCGAGRRHLGLDHGSWGQPLSRSEIRREWC